MSIAAAVDAAASEMKVRGVPGVSIALIDDGDVQMQACLGLRSASADAPVTDATVFEGASHGKPVFAYALRKLADAGSFSLDDPLGGQVDGVDLDAVTPRMILAHTSGIGNWVPGADPVVIGTEPGDAFEYSTTAYRILQHVVEQRFARSLDDLMAELVYEPLALRSTSYVWRDGFENVYAQGHDVNGKPLDKWKPRNVADAASGIHTTAYDLGIFFARVVDDAGASSLFEPQVRVASDWGGGPPVDTAWGLGFGLTRVGDAQHIWHWGWNDGFLSFATVSREGRKGVVVLTNSDNGLWVCKAAVTELLGAAHPAFPWLCHG